ncbi:MAG: hypothetical protein KAR42_02855 [candidate division Zixibacteria bacterium]|nr:hypothetical protein [candidate division Zixibacteria bacterium]
MSLAKKQIQSYLSHCDTTTAKKYIKNEQVQGIRRRQVKPIRCNSLTGFRLQVFLF